MQEKVNFLRSVHLFSELDEFELLDLAAIAGEYTFKDNAVIAYQRDVADALYIVKSGRLDWFSMAPDGTIQSSSRYFPRQYFKDIWLFSVGIHDATVRAAQEGSMIGIRSVDFANYLAQHPGVYRKIEEKLSPEAQTALRSTATALPPSRRYQRIRLLPDEQIKYESFRSRWLLLYYIFFPAFLSLFIPIALLAALIATQGGLPRPIFLTIPALSFLIPFVFVIFRYIDWANDYLLITNKHLVHREFELSRFTTATLKQPIDQIQSVSVTKPSLLSNFLNVGTVRVTTSAQQEALMFDYIQNPDEVRRVLDDLKARQRSVAESRTQETVRQSLEKYFGIEPQYVPVVLPAEEAPAPPPPPKRSLRSWWRRYFGYRVEESGTITYRKHWLILLRRVWAIVAFMLATVVLFAALAWRFSGSTAQVVLFGTIIFFVEFLVFLYNFDDWRNDIYQLTPRSVVDIDRAPLGFSVSRKEADLENVQNVRADQPSLFATFFGYGFVYIDTAGASAEIVFENVHNPNRIQTEIFRQRELVTQRKRMGTEEQRRRELTLLLDVFKQANEQSVLPQRTPPLEEEAEGPDEPLPF